MVLVLLLCGAAGLALPSPGFAQEQETDPLATTPPAPTDTHETGTSGGWLRQFGRDGRYLFTFPTRATRRGAWTTVGFLAGTGLVLHLDDRIRVEAREDSASPRTQQYASRISGLGSEASAVAGLGLFYLGARAAKSEYGMSTAGTAFEALLWCMPITAAAKSIFGRARPSGQADARDFFHNDGIFPSGHATRSFAIAAVLADRYGARAAWFAYPTAGLIGLSTIGRDVHWASDVMAGAGLGLAIGKGIAHRHPGREEARADEGRLAWQFTPAPGGGFFTLRF
ncbi:MAG TPA: phosphatase PAP2 family protein [Candidatus Polarisedimenticolia bacterium]|nr:phosphatase PAP2 family protein [Candidatus Polarisedimenticolia bacterium]